MSTKKAPRPTALGVQCVEQGLPAAMNRKIEAAQNQIGYQNASWGNEAGDSLFLYINTFTISLSTNGIFSVAI